MKNSVSHLSLRAALVALVSLNLTGCARNINSDHYAADHVGEAVETHEGTIVAKRQVTVQEGEKLQDNVAGLVGGGLAGGVLGSLFGGGRGRVLTTAGGAAAGALAGSQAQKALSKQEAWEYTVKLNSGAMRTVVQGMDVNLGIGQKVLLQVSHQGRSRITPM